MKYNSQYTTPTEYDSNSYLTTIVKTIGVLSLAYLAYQKRETINQGLVKAKDSANKMVEPLATGIKDTTNNLKETVSSGLNSMKKSTNVLQDYFQDKTQDAAQAFSSLGDQLENKYQKLEGSAKDTYKSQLVSLRDKLDDLIDKADDKLDKHIDKVDNKNDFSKNLSGTHTAH